LTHRHRRQSLIDQQRGTLRHSSGAATPTEAAPLAAEGHQLLGMATGTAHPQEPMFQSAALQVILKFPPQEPRKGPSFGLEAREEIGVAVVDDLTE
jgi:hypothetical protein